MAYPSEADLAPYAVRAGEAGGRMHSEPDCPGRNPFELDRHRIIESAAFRRLEGKTQVFAPSKHDHFRTRLTHTIEVTQIARYLAVALQANEALVEAITLAHDLGHPPFGHAGEVALDESTASQGGFNHNAHSLRVVDYLEHPFPAFRGLNLTAETRSGLLTHATRYDVPGSIPDRSGGASPRATDFPRAAGSGPRGPTDPARAAGAMQSRSIGSPGGPTVPGDASSVAGTLPTAPSVEAQIASIADRIAYNCHDLEDAIGAGFIGLQELESVALWRDAYSDAAGKHEAEHIHAIRRLVLDTLLDAVLGDVTATSRELLAPIRSLDQVRQADRVLVGFSAEMETRVAELERFLAERVYGHPEVAGMDAKGRRRVLALFDAYRGKPDALPRRFAARIDEQSPDRVICDYIAGMTDRFCTTEHGRVLASHGRRT